MTLRRRRFLSISAAFIAAPAYAQRRSWNGRAFGAEVSVTLVGAKEHIDQTLLDVQQLVRRIEAQFSLYVSSSELARLNRNGHLRPSKEFSALMRIADRAHQLTAGLFDPSVQPLWQALAQNGDVERARALIGWHKVSFDDDLIRMAPGQALTFNGIAQGFATDLVVEFLEQRGYGNALINIGEYRGQGGPWRLGIADPVHGLVATRTITKGAIATSSPMATPLADGGHILHHTETPLWSTVSVEASTAAMADALSTGLVLADKTLVQTLRDASVMTRVLLVNSAGEITTM